MQNHYKKIIVVVVLITAILFIPFFPITVVPEWELQFLNKDGSAVSSVTVDQIWVDYSLGWMSKEKSDLGLRTDANGYIKLPARHIYVSVFGVISSPIRDQIASINPHASFGPSSYLICRGTQNCVVSYKEGNEKPQLVLLW